MEKNHLISIIIPVYHTGAALKRCVESVLSQTYPHFEIILVNDGSTEEDADACDFYADADRRVSVVHKENGGVSSARNAGLSRAKGDFILFIDSDDYIEKDMLKKLLNTILSTDADLAASGMVYIYPDGRRQNKDIISGTIALDASLNEEFKKLYANYFFNSIWAKLYRTQIIRQYGIHCNEDFSIFEDCSFVMEYLSHCKTAALTGRSDYYYIQAETPSLMKRFNENALSAYEYYFASSAWLRKILDGGNLESYYQYQESVIWNFITQIFSRSKKSLKEKKKLLGQFSESDAVQEVLTYTTAHPSGGLSKLRRSMILHKNTTALSLLLYFRYLGK